MTQTPVHTIDLNFQGIEGTIASYLIPHPDGAVLVESGPGSTLPALERGLKAQGMTLKDVTHVLLTHIHLDHAGAAGALARGGAQIYVHHVGAPHMIDPEKLLKSAGRIYGEMMEPLWGDFLPVPEEQLTVLEDEDTIEVGRLCFRALDTPGHAYHHMTYLFEDLCFSGDIGGVRLGGLQHLRLPFPPPEFHLEKWRTSLDRLRGEHFERIAPTHFGIYEDVSWHLDAIEQALDEVDDWMEQTLPADPPIEQLRQDFGAWNEVIAQQKGLDTAMLKAFEAANPAFMSADGLQRYWRKYRQAGSDA